MGWKPAHVESADCFNYRLTQVRGKPRLPLLYASLVGGATFILASNESGGGPRLLRARGGRGRWTGRELIGWEAGHHGWLSPGTRTDLWWSGGRETGSLPSPSYGAAVPRPVSCLLPSTPNYRGSLQTVRIGAGPRERQNAACDEDHEERSDPWSR